MSWATGCISCCIEKSLIQCIAGLEKCLQSKNYAILVRYDLETDFDKKTYIHTTFFQKKATLKKEYKNIKLFLFTFVPILKIHFLVLSKT